MRFEAATDMNLAGFASRHPGMTRTGAAALLVEEGLRMDAHPGVMFRDGPAGRRAVLTSGPDIWEIIRAIASARTHQPGLAATEALDLVSENTGVPHRMLEVAIAYYADYPDEIDTLIKSADQAEQSAELTEQRRRGLLGA